MVWRRGLAQPLAGGGADSADAPGGTFRDLMQRRITEVLIVSSQYDYFIMEEDGGLVEQISSAYLDLHLSRAPRLHRAASAAEALELLEHRRYDLVVTMRQIGDMDALAFGREVKRLQPGMPVVLLLHRMADVPAVSAADADPGIDRVFVWSGDSSVFLAIIKCVEDMMNVDPDIASANVRVIILLEDAPRYYSTFLPVLYAEIMRYCQAILPEDINTMHRLYRMRARPKILLARNYEEARALYERYRSNALALISDIEVPREGKLAPQAGIEFCRECRRESPNMPVLFLSASEKGREFVRELDAVFISKTSPSLTYELRDFIAGSLGFGDFVFRSPDGREVARAATLMQMEAMLPKVPDESLRHHLEHRHFGNWFVARGEFTLAEAVERRFAGGVGELAAAREFLIEAIARNSVDRRKGRISDFSPQGLGSENFLMRLGRGSLGGKARGLAFLAHLMSRVDFEKEFPGVAVRIPRTVAVSVGEFDRFIEENGLRRFTVEERPDGEIAEAFLAGRLPEELAEGLEVLLEKVRYPLAVRSSSLLEDSHNVPFAGVYETYMLPNCHEDLAVRREQLHRAVKLVYASVFYGGARRYLESVNVRLAEEKMGIVVQEIVGRHHGPRFYPDISGVAHSYNFYPTGYLKPEDGVTHVALGLGKIVTDDGEALRFSPAHPGILPQFSNVRDYLDLSQKHFYALDIGTPAAMPVMDDSSDLVRCTLAEAEADGALHHVGAVYVPEDDAIRDGVGGKGHRLVTFGNILKNNSFPLAKLLGRFLAMGQAGMGVPVDLEFAAKLPPPGERGEGGGVPEFHLLQIRPMFATGDEAAVSLDGIDEADVLCRSRNTMSNGELDGIRDVVYVVPERFNLLRTHQIAEEFGRINQKLLAEKRPYLAIGMGRWGTTEASLGIPVKWSQICGAKALIETGTADYVIDPSHGTHFFQNMTAMRVAYMNVHPGSDPMDWAWLAAQQPVEELKFVRHVRLERPIRVLIDGRKREGAVLKR